MDVEGKEGYLFDTSEKGLSIIFNEIHFLTIDKIFNSVVKDHKIKFISKSYRKYKDKWIVGGIYKGNLNNLIEG